MEFMLWGIIVIARLPVCPDAAEQWFLVLLDPPHVFKAFRKLEANGVGEEVAEEGSEAGEDTVGDEGGHVPHVHIRERLQEVAAHL